MKPNPSVATTGVDVTTNSDNTPKFIAISLPDRPNSEAAWLHFRIDRTKFPIFTRADFDWLKDL